MIEELVFSSVFAADEYLYLSPVSGLTMVNGFKLEMSFGRSNLMKWSYPSIAIRDLGYRCSLKYASKMVHPKLFDMFHKFTRRVDFILLRMNERNKMRTSD
jgi:hypothetical protein